MTIRNLSEETHRAIKLRAKLKGRSAEAEVRAILDEAVTPPERIRVGTELAKFGKLLRGLELDILAAIAAVHGFTVATRDATPFQAAGVPVLNPWNA